MIHNFSKDFIAHLSSKVWSLSPMEVEKILSSFEGDVFEEVVEQPVKHPIEKVNDKYPNGWYCESSPKLNNDYEEAVGRTLSRNWELMGWNMFIDVPNCYNACSKGNDRISPTATLITKEDYLSITSGEGVKDTTTTERDYSGVRFKNASGNKYQLCKRGDGLYGILGSPALGWIQYEVNDNFSSGIWIELSKETPYYKTMYETLSNQIKQLVK